MRQIRISNCEPGMILGKAIFNGNLILLETGALLTNSYIERLKDLGITEIYIEDDMSKGIVIHDVVKEEIRQEAVQFIKESMDNYTSMQLINSAEAIEIVNKILEDILSSDDVIINLMDIKTRDSYTYSHCVNVCILSVITGIKLNLNIHQLKELGVGALLHDIGKLMIPTEILLKKAALSTDEYEIVKGHSIFGYDILKKLPHISEVSARVALEHHERFDGKGYPMGLQNDQIHLFSRIVAITDIFDALTSNRIYRNKISTNQAIEYLTVIAAPTLDSRVLNCFIEIIPPFPVGSGVILNNGEKGVVISVNKNFPTRPVVRIVFNSDGSKKELYEEVNLAEKVSYTIVNNAELIKQPLG